MGDWVFVCATSQLLPGETTVAWDGDTPILVLNYDGDYYAMEDKCSHEDFELSAGHFDADEATIECALHGAKFDVRDGRCLLGGEDAALQAVALMRQGTIVPVDFSLDMAPSDHVERKGYLRLRNLPVNEMANTVLVVKLEFDQLPGAAQTPAGSASGQPGKQ